MACQHGGDHFPWKNSCIFIALTFSSQTKFSAAYLNVSMRTTCRESYRLAKRFHGYLLSCAPPHRHITMPKTELHHIDGVAARRGSLSLEKNSCIFIPLTFSSQTKCSAAYLNVSMRTTCRESYRVAKQCYGYLLSCEPLHRHHHAEDSAPSHGRSGSTAGITFPGK
jgi:hypothetical protein